MNRTDDVYEFILQYALEHGYLPTRSMVVEGTDMNRNVVDYSFDKLAERGDIEFDRNDKGKIIGYRVAGMKMMNEDTVLRFIGDVQEKFKDFMPEGGAFTEQQCKQTGPCFARDRGGGCRVLNNTDFDGICPFQKEKRTDRYTNQMLTERENEQSRQGIPSTN